MEDKKQILDLLKAEFNRWEELLGGLSEEQITARRLASGWSIKDVMAHLMAWQQRSIARLQAGLLNQPPEFPKWVENIDPEQDDADPINAWIYATYRERPWESVYRDWRAGFMRCLELGEAIPESDLLEAGKYPWMDGMPLSMVLLGTYEHHQVDHFEPLLAWLRQQGDEPAH